MEDLQDKIIELMDLFDGEVTTADKIERPQRALDKQAIDDFMDRNPMAGGGMLVQPSADGSRPGYKEETTKYGSRIKYDTKLEKYVKIKQDKDGKTTKIYQKPNENIKKFLQRTGPKIPTSVEKQKIIKAFPNTKFNFKEYPMYGVKKYLIPGDTNKTNPKYSEVTRFVNNDFKIAKGKYKDVILSVADQNIIMDNFELPADQEKWNFRTKNNPNGFKFGFPITADGKNDSLAKRVERKLGKKEKYTIAADISSPKGWMMNAMERLYKQEIKAGVKPKDLTYKPKFNDKGIIVGFTDNTAAGKGNTYYGLKKNTQEDASPWTAHADYKRIDKFLDIADGVKQEPGKILQKILDEKGLSQLGGSKKVGEKFTLTLNDILSHQRYYNVLSKTSPKALLERQIVLHHTKQVGGDLAQAAATKDLQLLTGAVNANVNKLENTAKKRKLNADEILDLKNYGAKIVDFDGKVVGGGFINPKKQYASIEKEALEYAKGDQFNVKTVASYLERLGCGQAAGGRVFYNEGAFGLTKCAEKGRLKLENIVTKGASNADDAILAKSILKAGGGLKSAFALRNIFGPAAIAATVAFEGGLIGYDMLTSGKTLREAFGDNLLNYALGKDYQIDPQEEMFKRFKGLGYDNQQIGGIKKALETMNTINTGANLAGSVKTQTEALEKSRGQPEPFMGPDDQMMTDTAGQRAEQNLKDAQERLTAFNQSLEAVDRPGGMKKEDVLSEYFSSGKYAEDLDLLDEAQKAAIVEQKQSALPTAFGKVFPKFEESRIQTISENLPFGGVNPAFNIPGARDATFIPGKTTGGLFGLAGGGIAKMAGDRSGPPPESGPNPQGLQGLMKRVKNI